MHRRQPRVVIFFGGQAASSDLSEESGYWVCQYIPRSNYEVTPVRINQNGHWQVPLGSLPQQGPVQRVMRKIFAAVPSLPAPKALERLLRKPVDALLTFVRGLGGDDGSLHGMGRALSIPVIGPSLPVCQQTSDKFICANRLQNIIASPTTKLFKHNTHPETVVDVTRGLFVPPLFVKPVHEEASIGVEAVNNIDELTTAVHRAQTTGDIIIQAAATGTEVNLTLYDDSQGRVHSLPPTVITPQKSSFYDFMSKRRPGRITLNTLAAPQSSTFKQVETTARDIYDDLGCAGIVSFDINVSGKKLQLLEVNTVPTLTSLTPLLQQLKIAHLHPGRLISQQINQHL